MVHYDPPLDPLLDSTIDIMYSSVAIANKLAKRFPEETDNYSYNC